MSETQTHPASPNQPQADSPQSDQSVPPNAEGTEPGSHGAESPADSPATPWIAPTSSGDTSQQSTGSRYGRDVWVNIFIPLGLLALAGLVVLLLGTVEPEKRPDPDTSRAGQLQALPPVRVASLQSLAETGQRLELQVDGTVVPFQEARVAAEVAGRVTFKSEQCEPGSYVEKDDLLMRIDPTDYELDVERLERQLEQEKQAIQEIDQEIRNTRRLVDVAEQDVQLQQQEVDRLSDLPKDFASRAEIDRANRTLLAARQQLVTVENQYDLLQQRRIRLQASVKLAETQLNSAKINLQRTEITAPIEGVIVSEDADLNTFVARGATLVTIENTSKVEVATKLRMDQLHWILDQRGETVDPNVRGYDLPDTPAIIQYEVGGRDGIVYRWKGRLFSYDGIGLDTATRTVPVRVVVEQPRQNVDASGEPTKINGAPALVRGMYVSVKLLVEPSSSLVVIPARALQPGNRVFQFVPDESVIKESESDAAADSPAEESGETDQEQTETDPSSSADAANADDEDDADEIVFDPQEWIPGRVLVREAIYPIDSIRVTSQRETELPPDLEPANRLWICETMQGELVSGGYVVVSPLGDVDRQTGLPVRAPRDSLSEESPGIGRVFNARAAEQNSETPTGTASGTASGTVKRNATSGEGA